MSRNGSLRFLHKRLYNTITLCHFFFFKNPPFCKKKVSKFLSQKIKIPLSAFRAKQMKISIWFLRMAIADRFPNVSFVNFCFSKKKTSGAGADADSLFAKYPTSLLTKLYATTTTALNISSYFLLTIYRLFFHFKT